MRQPGLKRWLWPALHCLSLALPVPRRCRGWLQSALIGLDAATVRAMRPKRRVLLVRFIAKALLCPFYRWGHGEGAGTRGEGRGRRARFGGADATPASPCTPWALAGWYVDVWMCLVGGAPCAKAPHRSSREQ